MSGFAFSGLVGVKAKLDITIFNRESWRHVANYAVESIVTSCDLYFITAPPSPRFVIHFFAFRLLINKSYDYYKDSPRSGGDSRSIFRYLALDLVQS